MQCPLCSNRRVGILGPERLFCADCAVEILYRDGQAQIFSCDEQGELRLMRELSADQSVVLTHFFTHLRGSRS